MDLLDPVRPPRGHRNSPVAARWPPRMPLRFDPLSRPLFLRLTCSFPFPARPQALEKIRATPQTQARCKRRSGEHTFFGSPAFPSSSHREPPKKRMSGMGTGIPPRGGLCVWGSPARAVANAPAGSRRCAGCWSRRISFAEAPCGSLRAHAKISVTSNAHFRREIPAKAEQSCNSYLVASP